MEQFLGQQKRVQNRGLARVSVQQSLDIRTSLALHCRELGVIVILILGEDVERGQIYLHGDARCREGVLCDLVSPQAIASLKLSNGAVRVAEVTVAHRLGGPRHIEESQDKVRRTRVQGGRNPTAS